MRIQHNIMSMNAYRNYNNNTKALSGNLEKLSSGYKINRAGDDAAGLAISEKMRAQITGLNAAQKNVKDGISLVKTAEGAMQEIEDMLNRMKYLATQSANGTYDNDVDRKNLQKEVLSLTAEIDRIADSANFNGIYMLRGDGNLSGSTAGGTEAVTIDGLDTVTSTVNFTNGVAGTTEPSWTVDFSGISFDKAGDVKVTLGGEEYTIAVTEEMTAAEFAQAVKEQIDGGAGYNDTTGGAYTPTLSGTQLTLQAANQAVETDATLFDDFAIEAAEAADAAGDSDGDSAAGASFTVDLSGVGGVENGKTYTITVGSATAVESDATAGTNASDLATAFDGKEVTVDGVVYTISADTDKLTFTEKTPGDTPTTAPADGTSITLGDGTTQAPSTPNALTGAGSLATADAQDGEEASGSGSAGGGKDFTSIQLQIGDTADPFNQLTVQVGSMKSSMMGQDFTMTTNPQTGVTTYTRTGNQQTISQIDISTAAGAQKAIESIKDAINYVSSVRGDLGALSNRLDHTANNLSVMAENIQDAESTIRDTDVAEEMMAYTKNNILIQSAQAMLAQANQVPQGVLQLLQ